MYQVTRLRAVSPEKIVKLRRAALWARLTYCVQGHAHLAPPINPTSLIPLPDSCQVRDYFVYKDMYNPSASSRTELLAAGRPHLSTLSSTPCID